MFFILLAYSLGTTDKQEGERLEAAPISLTDRSKVVLCGLAGSLGFESLRATRVDSDLLGLGSAFFANLIFNTPFS